jgi:hypothetical protein
LEQQPVVEVVEKPAEQTKEIITEGVTPIHDTGGGYVEFEDKLFQRDALKELRPDLFRIKADNVGNQSQTNFGTQFPKIAKKGDIFVRVDVMPNRVFKFDGKKWLEQNKALSQSYLDKDYLEFLISKVQRGEYDVDQLTDTEKMELEEYLKGTQNT